jgi:hypothetical protein
MLTLHFTLPVLASVKSCFHAGMTMKISRSIVTVAVVIALMVLALVMAPTLNAAPTGPSVRFQFLGTLHPPGPPNYPLLVNGLLSSGSGLTLSGAIFLTPQQPPSTTVNSPLTSCGRVPVTGTIQPPSSTSQPTDDSLTVTGTLASPSSSPTSCPAGAVTLDIQLFTGQTTLTVKEASGPIVWTGTVSLVMQVNANTVGG